MQTKNCQNCNNNFIITEDDQQFYAKMKVPFPTFCPDCRIIRRMVFIDLRILYKRNCNLCKKGIVSIYHKDVLFPVYCNKCWYSDNWDVMKYGIDYDFNKPFFEQFEKLMQVVPKMGLMNINSVNCDYSHAYNSKNCYLSDVDWSENCAYVHGAKCRDSFDLYGCYNVENCYECIYCNNSYKCFFSIFASNCMNSSFIYDSNNLADCFACVNLKNKNYCIFNKQYSKEEYYKELEKYDTGSFQNLIKIKNKFLNLKMKLPHRYSYQYRSINCTGDNLRNVNNCSYCFDSKQGVEDSKYILNGGFMLKDSYDLTSGGVNSSLLYEAVIAGENLSKSKFLFLVVNGMSIDYSMQCFSCKNLFGCIGLRNKQYCILNKQYTKQEYEELVPKIIEHMGS